MKRYSIGVDFGSLSARSVVLDLETGEIVAQAVSPYLHGILTEQLPDGTPLGSDWALQVPADYHLALFDAVRESVKLAHVLPEQIVGIGIDATASTVLPTLSDGTPLCELPRFASEPHAYIKLWKHHSAQKYAEKMEELAVSEDPLWFVQSGRKISSEHFLPKAVQIAAEAPEVYAAADRIVEVGDWLVQQLCAEESRNYCAAAFKTYYREESGDLSPDFLQKLCPAVLNLSEKFPRRILKAGDCAGCLTEEAAASLGLIPGIPVSAAAVDAHVTMVGCHVAKPGELVMVVGTSACELLLDRGLYEVSGINGTVYEGLLPEVYIYEAGQSCAGDMIAWFFDNAIPSALAEEAKKSGKSIHTLMEEKAAACPPGANGLVALDWWNGARSLPMDFELTGLLIGLTIESEPAEIYRALLESIVFGTKRILQELEQQGMTVSRIIAAGGIPLKNELMMQIYADVCGVEVYCPLQEQTGAVGSALLGSAAGSGGFRGLPDLINALPRQPLKIYRPNQEAVEQYRQVYGLYAELYEYFSTNKRIMHRLKSLRKTEC